MLLKTSKKIGCVSDGPTLPPLSQLVNAPTTAPVSSASTLRQSHASAETVSLSLCDKFASTVRLNEDNTMPRHDAATLDDGRQRFENQSKIK